MICARIGPSVISVCSLFAFAIFLLSVNSRRQTGLTA